MEKSLNVITYWEITLTQLLFYVQKSGGGYRSGIFVTFNDFNIPPYFIAAWVTVNENTRCPVLRIIFDD